MSEHILLSFALDGAGGGRPAGHDEISALLKSETLAWVHLDAGNPATRGWLEAEVPDLHGSIINALLADETRPRMTQIGDGVLLILRGVNLNENAAPEDMVSIRLWVTERQIVSVRLRRLKAVQDLTERLEGGTGPRDPGEFICMLAAKLLARMAPVLSDLDERTDKIEEDLLDEPTAQLRAAIVEVRKQAIVLRRYIAPQRDAIDQLRSSDAGWLDEHHRRELVESHNHVTRYVEDLDAIRERAQIVKDELANILSDTLNRNMYILSVIAAIFLPLGFLTGLLGVNLGGIPGSDTEAAFWVFAGLLGLVVAAQVYLFRRLKWF